MCIIKAETNKTTEVLEVEKSPKHYRTYISESDILRNHGQESFTANNVSRHFSLYGFKLIEARLAPIRDL